MSYITVTKYIENVGEEIEVEVGFDFSPAEPMTRHYPGNDADVDICEVRRADNGAEIFLIGDNEELLREELLNDHLENMRAERDYDPYEWIR